MTTLFTSEAAAASVRKLPKTGELTAQATIVAEAIILAVETNPDTMLDEFESSKKGEIAALDSLIAQSFQLDSLDISYLRELQTEELEAMLRSQQSKRSRSLANEMTRDNYKSFVSAYVAEVLLRLALGKERKATGRSTGFAVYSAEQLEELSGNQEEVKRALRNIQSRKCILKTKLVENYKLSVGSDEEPSDEVLQGLLNGSVEYDKLLSIEEQLKSVRVPTKSVRTNKLAVQIKQTIGDVDIATLKPAEAKRLLEEVLQHLPEDVPPAIEEATEETA